MAKSDRRNSVEIEGLSWAMDENTQAKEKAVVEARRQRGQAKGSRLRETAHRSIAEIND